MPEYPIDLGEQPDLPKLLQDDRDKGVPVRLDAPVRSQRMPARAGGMLSTILPAAAVAGGVGSPESLAGTDRRRSRLWVCAVDHPIWLALTRAQITAGAGTYLPTGKDLDITHFEQVYAAAADAFDTRVSFLVELWAD